MNGAEWLDQRAAESERRLRAISLRELLAMKVPPRELLLDPWLPSSGIAMVYAPRGIGKSFLAMSVANTLSAGGDFLCWRAPNPVRVLYIDGELPLSDVQARFAGIIQGAGKATENGDFLKILTPDVQRLGIPSLATFEGQAAIEPFADDARVIVVDSIMTLCLSSTSASSDESWQNVQAWALRMRAKGKSVIFIHHSGKNGDQLGTSAREIVLDTVIKLEHPKGEGETSENGARFDLSFTKARGFYGEKAKSISLELLNDGGRLIWAWQAKESKTMERVVDLYNDGHQQKEIAAELGIHKTTVSYHINRAKADGLVR